MDGVAKYYNNKSDYGISSTRLNRIVELCGGVNNKRILDVGCGNGVLGKTLIDKGAIVDGCDLSGDAIDGAAKVLNKAFIFDIENDNYKDIEKNYDIVIATEVIEHLFLPELFIKNIKNLVKENGLIIITTPNFLMWTLRLRMLFGQFEYTESGFWDRGHIHFFTYKTFLKTLIENGLTIEQENHIFHPKIPLSIARLKPGLFGYQFIVSAKKHS